MIVTLRTRSDFPIRLGEEFVVRDGTGKGVERWRHVSGPRTSNTDKGHERHDFSIQVLEPE